MFVPSTRALPLEILRHSTVGKRQFSHHQKVIVIQKLVGLRENPDLETGLLEGIVLSNWSYAEGE